jgi:hypothetical protein
MCNSLSRSWAQRRGTAIQPVEGGDFRLGQGAIEHGKIVE